MTLGILSLLIISRSTIFEVYYVLVHLDEKAFPPTRYHFSWICYALRFDISWPINKVDTTKPLFFTYSISLRDSRISQARMIISDWKGNDFYCIYGYMYVGKAPRAFFAHSYKRPKKCVLRSSVQLFIFAALRFFLRPFYISTHGCTSSNNK